MEDHHETRKDKGDESEWFVGLSCRTVWASLVYEDEEILVGICYLPWLARASTDRIARRLHGGICWRCGKTTAGTTSKGG
jgi:hypothetical protein